MEKNKIMELVLEILDDTLSEMDDYDPVKIPPLNGSTRLIGSQSLLSSIKLVSLIVGIEDKLADEQDIYITIADERAMSMEKSPFRTVESLSSYISTLVREHGAFL